jgi:hypothetical protein
MSGKNNVNKDYYVTAGRDQPDDNAAARLPAGVMSDRGTGGHHRRGAPRQNFIPGAAPVGERPEARDMPATPEAQTSAGKTGTRSGSRKRASANRGGKAPAGTRAKAGASGKASRRPANVRRAKRGMTRAEAATRRPAAQAAGRRQANPARRTTRRTTTRRRAA